MSVEVNTSRDSLPSAWPSCEPNAMPPIWVMIAISGPAIARASSGTPPGRACDHTEPICSAIGSHSRFQVSMVLSTQSCGVHATARVAPAGSAVAPSSQVSARCTASLTADAVDSETGATNPIDDDASLRAMS